MLKTRFIAATIAALAVPFIAHATELSVTVDNIVDIEGTLQIGLFDLAGYDSGKAVTGEIVSVDGNSVTASFGDIPEGEYAIKLYQDVNGDGEMNTNPFGMPTEPFAFSNSAKGRFGPAKWDAAKFTVSGETATHTISLN